MTPQKYEVVNCIPQQLYECLEQFKEQQGLNSISQAVNTIIEDYFELKSCQNNTSDRLTKIVENLQHEVADLKRQMSQIQQDSTLRDRLNQFQTKKSQEKSLNTKQLAARLEVKETDIEQHKTDGNEFVEWTKSKDPERIPWRYTGANLFTCKVEN